MCNIVGQIYWNKAERGLEIKSLAQCHMLISFHLSETSGMI